MQPPYQINLSRQAQKFLSTLAKSNPSHYRQIINDIAAFALTQQSPHIKPLKGNWKNYSRLKIGRYRAIYQFDHPGRVLNIYVIKRRKDLY